MTSDMGLQRVQRSGEIATAAMAAKAKAMVEARYVIAFNNPRNIEQARIDILASCRRDEFAETARYKRPCGSKLINGRWEEQYAVGFSIRFAEEAIKAMNNINVESVTIYEDDDKRTLMISVTDLQSNLTYGKEVSISKTVERKKPKEGQEVLSKRQNSLGDTVFLVRATEDEIANKIAANESKIIRNFGLRLVPSDILEEANAAIDKTLKDGGADPKAAAKKIFDSFAAINVGPQDLEKYLGHTLTTISPNELVDLRAVYATIKDGESSWSDYVAEREQKKKPDLKQEAAAATAPATVDVAQGTPRRRAPKPAATPEQAIAEGVAAKTHEAPAAPVIPSTAQVVSKEMVIKFITDAGVPFDDFRDFLVADGHVKDADSFGGFDDVPAAVYEALHKNAAALPKLVKMFGKKE